MSSEQDVHNLEITNEDFQVLIRSDPALQVKLSNIALSRRNLALEAENASFREQLTKLNGTDGVTEVPIATSRK